MVRIFICGQSFRSVATVMIVVSYGWWCLSFVQFDLSELNGELREYTSVNLICYVACDWCQSVSSSMMRMVLSSLLMMTRVRTLRFTSISVIEWIVVMGIVLFPWTQRYGIHDDSGDAAKSLWMVTKQHQLWCRVPVITAHGGDCLQYGRLWRLQLCRSVMTVIVVVSYW